MIEIRENLNEFRRNWICPSYIECCTSPWIFSKFPSIGLISHVLA
jgi:hypothetical protein